MTLTLLLDLDDTLLNTNLQAFVPAYFQALSKDLAPRVPPEKMLRALLAGTQKMNESDDFSRTLSEVFDEVFYPMIDIPRGELDAAIEHFYDTVFPTLQGLTSPVPDAKPFVDWAFSQGYRIAIATDPLLPRKATFHRLRWAGFEPEQFEVVSSYEHFHFSKTHPAYYAEVLGRMGWQEGPVLMVGNDMERDIIPAKRLGLATWLVESESASSPGPEADRCGTFANLREWLESADPASLTPSFQSVESIVAIMSAIPAALNGLSRGLSAEAWDYKASEADWSLTELVCHLRDTEREVHHIQIGMFNGNEEPFIPRPDTAVWASQRNYLHEDGAKALREFNAARRETLALLSGLNAADWERKARHAIFGPTNFLEVVSFIASHDRLHVRQAWSLLKRD